MNLSKQDHRVRLDFVVWDSVQHKQHSYNTAEVSHKFWCKTPWRIRIPRSAMSLKGRLGFWVFTVLLNDACRIDESGWQQIPNWRLRDAELPRHYLSSVHCINDLLNIKSDIWLCFCLVCACPKQDQTGSQDTSVESLLFFHLPVCCRGGIQSQDLAQEMSLPTEASLQPSYSNIFHLQTKVRTGEIAQSVRHAVSRCCSPHL